MYSRTALADERRKHRDQAHGGHIPDGEQVLEPESLLTSLSNVPRGQLLTTVVIALVIVAALWLR
ncbi:hypothetical protein [Embleya sp. AB8]|uniref:hypothetical protein n=1 Tax=Embleya sp. AB8 TaxID=3156304 RepID=UPI003C7269B0